MTQAVSDNKAALPVKRRSAAVHNGIFQVRSNLKMLIINFVLHLLALPLIAGMMIYELSKNGSLDHFNDVYMVIGVLCTGAGVISGLVTAMTVFRSLYNKQMVDMENSLPMTAGQRFRSNFFSGLFTYIVPFMAAEVVSGILLAVGNALFEGKTLMRSETVNGVHTTWVCDAYSEFIPISVKLIFGGLMIMIMTYTFWVLIMTCCGSMFETIAFGIAANGMIPAVLLSLMYYSNEFYGMELGEYFEGIIGVTSPIGAVYGLIETFNSQTAARLIGSSGNSFISSAFFSWFIPVLFFTLLLFFAAMFLYCRRKSEATGKAFAYKGFYHTIMCLGIFVLITIMNPMEDSDFILPAVIVTVVIYMLLDVITNRGFKHFKRGCIGYVITTACSFVILLAVSQTEWFGRVYAVPAAASVNSAEIYYGGVFDGNKYTFTISDPENVQTVIDFHKKQLDIHKTDKNGYGFSSGLISIRYKLKNGSEMYREYSIYHEALSELMPLDISDEYKQQYIDQVTESIEMSMGRYLENIEYDKERYGTYYSDDRTWREYSTFYIRDKFNHMGYESEYNLMELPADFSQKLIACLKEDIGNMTYDDYYYSDTPEYCIIELPGTPYGIDIPRRSFTVRGCYENTIGYLKEYGITTSDPYITDFRIAHFVTDNDVSVAASDLYPYTLVSFADININQLNEMTKPMLQELLDNSVSMYITGGDVYTISAGGTAAYIPEEYITYAETLLSTYAVN